MLFLLRLIVICTGSIVYGIPKPEEVKSYISVDQESIKVKHLRDHNAHFDHDAFLGDQAKAFDHFDPNESKRRLGIVADKIDEDNDGYVTISELKKWIQYTQRRYIDDDVSRMWDQHSHGDDAISWEVYRKEIYGFIDEMEEDMLEQEEHGMSYKAMLRRDRRRWGVADQDMDDKLTKDELKAFLHPEDNAIMSEVVLTETIEDIDKDKDGKVSVEEYIADMYKNSEPNEEEPEWVTSERESFTAFRDLDGDGFLDREEVRNWVVPKDFDHAESEAKHLVFEADQNSDEKLTKQEILNKYDLFVGSQATDFVNLGVTLRVTSTQYISLERGNYGLYDLNTYLNFQKMEGDFFQWDLHFSKK